MARLYNQTKNALSWKMGEAERFTCDPWGAVEIPEDLVWAAESRGLPLGLVPVAPELRARARVADEQAANQEAPLRALREAADVAKAAERAAKAELERVQVELSESRSELQAAKELVAGLRHELSQSRSDKEAAEALLVDAGKSATAAEERAIRAEAMLSESKPKQEKQKPSRAE